MTKQYFSTLLKRVGVSSLIGMAVVLLMVACPKPEDKKEKDSSKATVTVAPTFKASNPITADTAAGFKVEWDAVGLAGKKNKDGGKLTKADVKYKVYYTSRGKAARTLLSGANTNTNVKMAAIIGHAAKSKTAGVLVPTKNALTVTVKDRVFKGIVYIVLEAINSDKTALSKVLSYDIGKPAALSTTIFTAVRGDNVGEIKTVKFTAPGTPFGKDEAGKDFADASKFKYFLYYAQGVTFGASADKAAKVAAIVKKVGAATVQVKPSAGTIDLTASKEKGAVEIVAGTTYVLQKLTGGGKPYSLFVRVVHPDSVVDVTNAKANQVGDFALDSRVLTVGAKSAATAPVAPTFDASLTKVFPVANRSGAGFEVVWTASNVVGKKTADGKPLTAANVLYKVYFTADTVDANPDAAAIKTAAAEDGKKTAKTAGVVQVKGKLTVTVKDQKFTGKEKLYVAIEAFNDTDDTVAAAVISAVKSFVVTAAGTGATVPAIVVAAATGGGDPVGSVKVTLTDATNWGFSNAKALDKKDVTLWLYYSAANALPAAVITAVGNKAVVVRGTTVESTDKSKGAIQLDNADADGIYIIQGLAANKYWFALRVIHPDANPAVAPAAPKADERDEFKRDIAAIKVDATPKS